VEVESGSTLLTVLSVVEGLVFCKEGSLLGKAFEGLEKWQ